MTIESLRVHIHRRMDEQDRKREVLGEKVDGLRNKVEEVRVAVESTKASASAGHSRDGRVGKTLGWAAAGIITAAGLLVRDRMTK